MINTSKNFSILIQLTCILLLFTQIQSQNLFNYSIPFTLQDAKQFTYASAAAYCNESWLIDFNCGSVCNNLTGYQYYFGYNSPLDEFEQLQFIMIYNDNTNRFVTSFRGTVKIFQLIHELSLSESIPYTIHNITDAETDSYFGGYYISNLRNTFLQALQNATKQFPDYQYVFTGHSLGGALATLASQDAILSGVLPQSSVLMYTFGSPRVVNWYLAENADLLYAGLYRVVHYQDIVPRLPPCSDENDTCVRVGGLNILDWNPWHVGLQIWFDVNFTSYQVCSDNFGEDPRCSDSVPDYDLSISQHIMYFGLHVGKQCIIDNEGGSEETEEEEEAKVVEEAEVEEEEEAPKAMVMDNNHIKSFFNFLLTNFI